MRVNSRFNERAGKQTDFFLHKSAVLLAALSAASMVMGVAEPALAMIPLAMVLGTMAERKTSGSNIQERKCDHV